MKSRRAFLQTAASIGIGSIAAACRAPRSTAGFRPVSPWQKLNVSLDRVIKETVGLRPYRKNGFRVEKEMLDNKIIVHNYGHGGSGWSLSWGTGNLAADLAESSSEKKFAVMGSGVVGIATARLLQMRGFEVTMYTKALPPHVTSSKATGTWSPSYRLIDDDLITSEFSERWKKAAMFSFTTYQNLLGLGDIVTWMDEYVVRNNLVRHMPGHSPLLEIPGLLPEEKVLQRHEHPFQPETVIKQTSMVFNIPSYLQKHLSDFLAYDGKVVIREFNSTDDVLSIPERCILNCTGLGSKALFNDNNLTPVAGQLSFLIPQPEFNYRLTTDNGYAIPRKDGIVLGGNALVGSWDENPDPAQTEKVVNALAEVMTTLRV
jgi:glycine/D-amino acid oxidase-like deaminating enzyme